MFEGLVNAGHWFVGVSSEALETKHETNTRYKMIRTANEIAFPSTVAMITGIAIAIIGIAALSGSIAGGLVLIAFGAAIFATAHDVHLCCDNLRAVHTDPIKRGKMMLNGDAETLCNEMLANTWYFADFFKADILGVIKEAEARDKLRR